MQIDRVAAVIRPRTPWEGLDLGFALGRRWFAPLLGIWWLMVLPVAALGAIWLGDSPSLWLILVWWFKPLYEAPLLFWLSRRLFRESLGLRGLWHARRQILSPRLLPNLLWRRLSPRRSFQMPLLMLEGLSGKARRRRQRVLQDPGGASAWLTIICVHLESILWLSVLLLVAAMIPEELPGLDLSAALLDEDSAPYWISNLLFLVAMSLMAPFYVAAGFALYLTRRTELEAWDLELQFRRVVVAPRWHPDRDRKPAWATMITLAAAVAAWLPQPLPAFSATPEQGRAEIEAVLEDEDFGRTREIETWVYVGKQDDQGEATEAPDWLLDLFRSLGQAGGRAAVVLKWLLLLAAATLVVVILHRVLGERRAARRTARRSAVDTSSSRPLPPPTRAALPADVPARARELIDRGDMREALALLYAASIALLERRHDLAVPPSATEAEYLSLVLEHRPAAEAELMQRMVGAWQRIAYAHSRPAPARLKALIDDWTRWEGGSHAV